MHLRQLGHSSSSGGGTPSGSTAPAEAERAVPNTPAMEARSACSNDNSSSDVLGDAERWANARRAALNRGDEVDCPICFQECHLHGRGAARVELLSCSHVFHSCCIDSFESFHVFERHICPVCRQNYQRRPWQPAITQPQLPLRPPRASSAAQQRQQQQRSRLPTDGRGHYLRQRG